MRWIGYILLLLLVFQSCEKEKSQVSFRVKVDGFSMKGDPNFPLPEYLAFNHRYSSGLISFTQDQQNHSFFVGEGEMENYLFKLPPGEYILDAKIPAASLYGQTTGSFLVASETVTITELTDTLVIGVDANCSLILVNDELQQLNEGPFIIERHSYTQSSFKSYPMARDSASGWYYAYFTPDPVLDDPSAFLWFYSGKPGMEEGGLSTTRFQMGHQYFINILE